MVVDTAKKWEKRERKKREKCIVAAAHYRRVAITVVKLCIRWNRCKKKLLTVSLSVSLHVFIRLHFFLHFYLLNTSALHFCENRVCAAFKFAAISFVTIFQANNTCYSHLWFCFCILLFLVHTSRLCKELVLCDLVLLLTNNVSTRSLYFFAKSLFCCLSEINQYCVMRSKILAQGKNKVLYVNSCL